MWIFCDESRIQMNTYRDNMHTNTPINMDLIITLFRSEDSNSMGKKWYEIVFTSELNSTAKWGFETKEIRDAEYKKICDKIFF